MESIKVSVHGGHLEVQKQRHLFENVKRRYSRTCWKLNANYALFLRAMWSVKGSGLKNYDRLEKLVWMHFKIVHEAYDRY